MVSPPSCCVTIGMPGTTGGTSSKMAVIPLEHAERRVVSDGCAAKAYNVPEPLAGSVSAKENRPSRSARVHWRKGASQSGWTSGDVHAPKNASQRSLVVAKTSAPGEVVPLTTG